MLVSVRPPTAAQPMTEMPQQLINPLLAPESTMEDGAISGPPPKTGTGGYRGFRHDLAPRLVPELAENEIRTPLMGSETSFPVQGLPRLLAGPQLI
jgi:hypothetical protein